MKGKEMHATPSISHVDKSEIIQDILITKPKIHFCGSLGAVGRQSILQEKGMSWFRLSEMVKGPQMLIFKSIKTF